MFFKTFLESICWACNRSNLQFRQFYTRNINKQWVLA